MQIISDTASILCRNHFHSPLIPMQETIWSQINDLASKSIPFIFLIDFQAKNHHLIPWSDLDPAEIQVVFPRFSNKRERNAQSIPQPSIQIKEMLPKTDYLDAFYKVKTHILLGNSFLTNLCVSVPINLTGDLFSVFYHAQAKYKIWFRNLWVCFSPETFITIQDDRIHSYPMKGTIAASVPNAADILRNDEKETAEHHTIVDLIRNDLNRVATDVRVDRFRYLEKIISQGAGLYQMSSQISGSLGSEWKSRLGNIFSALLPAGSISGAPKRKTVDIIRKAETHDRGFYTGVCFLFDGNQVDSCVLIRFIENTTAGYIYKTGGGITINSLPDKEYKELYDKVYLPLF
jgi:para-aminobenzoate synthetase component I